MPGAHCLELSLLVVSFAILPVTGCGESSETAQPDSGTSGARPEGWTEESHGKDATPRYDLVFPQGEVARIDVTIAADDWQAMLDDMTRLYGDFGAGGSEEIPTEVIDACEGMSEGDACSFVIDSTQLEGTCQLIWDDILGCDVPAGLPPDVATPCEGLVEGDSCSASTPSGSVDGTCLGLGELGCFPTMMIPACSGKAEGDTCSPPPPPGGEAPTGDCALSDGGTLFCLILPPSGPGGQPLATDENPIWVPAEVAFGGETWWHVGFRFKGNSSLSHTWQDGIYKLPFKLDFDQFEDRFPEVLDQRFWGFKRISFANNARDSSYLRDKVAGDLFRESGVPSPQRAFYRVYIDLGDGPEYFGLYTAAELPARPMYITQFGESGGNLYKPEGAGATWATGFAIDEEFFSKQNNEEAADWSDVDSAFAALHASRADAAAWRAELERYFDAPGFIRWLAINTVMQDWDSYGNSPHNYYLYGDPAEEGRLSWIPWDHNESLKEAGGIFPPLPLDVASFDSARWPLIDYLYGDSEYRALYWITVEEFAEGAFAETALRERLQSEHDLIAPFVTGADGERPGYTILGSGADFDTELESLFDHVATRNQAVANALQGL